MEMEAMERRMMKYMELTLSRLEPKYPAPPLTQQTHYQIPQTPYQLISPWLKPPQLAQAMPRN